MKNNAYSKYQKDLILRATPEELILMLYNGAIKFINIAIDNLKSEKKDIVKTHNAIIKSEKIIEELIASLNPKYDIAKDFERMYTYILERLIEANVRKDVDILVEVVGLLREFRDVWKEAMKISKRNNQKSNNYYNNKVL